nr:PREDICTED: semaphorin-3B [Latimeria chalumnae]|eukprot:XP_014343964.1 PREDICTED: semaphorin-3B [Latimeria chalumnae]
MCRICRFKSFFSFGVLRLLILLMSSNGGSLVSAWKLSQPRLQLRYTELVKSGRLQTLLLEESDFHSVLLDENDQKVYAAGKDHLLSASVENIASGVKKLYWPATPDRIEECKMAGKHPKLDCANFLRVLHFYNETHLYVCGTGAFQPRCAYVDTAVFNMEEHLMLEHMETECGKGKCPYDPRQQIATAMIDGELYAGISSDFMSRDTAFFRSLGHRHVIRTEQYDSKWFLVHNDIGGQRSLVNKWSTFLKARLVCSIPGADGLQTHFDELQDVFVVSGRGHRNALIYGLFTTSSNVLNGSAVCVYTMEDIVTAFKGWFSHKEGPDYKWLPFVGRVPFPRPGTCPSSTYGSYRSTREYPDDVIFFSRTHLLMYSSIYPINRRPVLVRVGVGYKFTRLVVDHVEAVDGQYDVMFIGTDSGLVLKAIYVPKASQETEETILEELQVFLDDSPVQAMTLSHKRQWLYVGSKSGLAQLLLFQCELYGKACTECCLARDPYCAWDGTSCSPYVTATRRRNTRQAGLNGNPLTQCFSQGAAVMEKVEEKLMLVARGNSTFLECLPKSRLAKVTWLQEANDTNGEFQKVASRDGIIIIEQGILIRQVDQKHAGTYFCQVEEHGFRWLLLKVRLVVMSPEQANYHGTVDASTHSKGPFHLPVTQSNHPWYRDILALINSPAHMDYYCEKMRQQEQQRKRNKGRLGNLYRRGVPGQERMKVGPATRKFKSKSQSSTLRSPRHIGG